MAEYVIIVAEHMEERLFLRPEELKTIVVALRELGLTYDEAVKLMGEVTEDAKSLRPIWGKPGEGGQKGSQLIKLGVALVAFPIPTIGVKKSLGAMLIAAGLVRKRMQHLHVVDVYGTLQDINRDLQKLMV